MNLRIYISSCTLLPLRENVFMYFAIYCKIIRENFRKPAKMSGSELVDGQSCESQKVTRMLSQDSEYDDALEVPDSLETIDNNEETLQVCKNKTESMDKGINLFYITYIYIFLLLCSYSFCSFVVNIVRFASTVFP